MPQKFHPLRTLFVTLIHLCLLLTLTMIGSWWLRDVAQGATPVTTARTTGHFAIPLLAPSGIFTDSGQLLGNANSINLALGDLDADSDLDVFVANTNGEGNQVWLNQGGAQGGTIGTFQAITQSLGTSNSTDIALGLLNDDAHLDAFVVNGTGVLQPNRVWFGDGSGNFSDSGQALGSAWSESVALGDLDGDGDLDAFVVNYNEDGNTVWLNNGGAQLGTAGIFTDTGQFLLSDLSNGNSVAVALGHLNGDAFLDAVVGNDGGPNTIWFNDGTGTFTEASQVLGNAKSFGIALADLDGDTDLDIFVANVGAGNRVYFNQGGAQAGTLGNFADSGQALGNNDSEGLDLADIDGDGDIDALVGNGNSQPNRLWLNQGGNQGGTEGIFADSGQALGNRNSTGLRIGDLDGDSDLDSFVVNRGQPNTVWFNIDLPTPGFTVIESADSSQVQEVGTTDTISVTLDAAPAADVVLDLISDDLGEMTASPSSLTFTSGNWAEAQPVLLTGVEDYAFDGDQVINLTLRVNPAASDDLYDAVGEQIVEVTVVDTTTQANSPPSITSAPILEGTAATQYLNLLTATDPDLATNPDEELTWRLTTFPDWLFLDDARDGTATLQGKPAHSDVGSHNVVVEIRDKLGKTDTQSYTIVVAPAVNTAPIAFTEQSTVEEDSRENRLHVLDNDQDLEDDPLTVTAVGSAEAGQVTIAPDGKAVLYTPNPGFVGYDFFEYTISDGVESATARTQVEVVNVNDAPMPQGDTLGVLEDQTITFRVLENDSDPDEEDQLGILAVTAAQHGQVIIDPGARSLTYIPEPNYAGPDSFTYTANDRLPADDEDPGLSAQATVSVTVFNVNDLPTVVDDSVTVDEDSSDNLLTPLANDSDLDGDVLNLVAIGTPLHGNATVEGNNVRYTPNFDVTESDSFSYTVTDGFGLSNGLITVQINPVQDAPIVGADQWRVTENHHDVPLDLLANDSDIDGDNLTIVGVSDPPHGTAQVGASGGNVLYTPDADYTGADQFNYTISDGHSQVEGTVEITVVPGNKRPIATDDTFTVVQDSTNQPLLVLENDHDADGDNLMITVVGQPAIGSSQVAINPIGSALLYTPPAGFTGGDSVRYTISDGTLTAEATVQITVRAAVNEADLRLSRRDEVTAVPAGEQSGLTTHFHIANDGPTNAVAVNLTAEMGSGVGAVHGTGAICTGSSDTVHCAVGELAAGATTTVTLHTLLNAPGTAGTLSATATVAGTTPDPNVANNSASATLTVAPAREQRQAGTVTIVADSFTPQGANTVALGNIRIGDHFVLPGDAATLTFDGAGNLNGNGTLTMLLGNLALLRGDIRAGTDGIGTPGSGATNVLTHAANFPVNDATVSSFDLGSGEVKLQATLAIGQADLNSTPQVELTIQPGPHFAGTTSAPFVVNYGDGEVLRLHSLTGDLVRQGSDYRLRASGVISYNLYTNNDGYVGALTLTDTVDYRGTITNVLVSLHPDGTITERDESLADLTLLIDYVTLTLAPLTLDSRGLLAAVGTWRLPAVQGHQQHYEQNVRIGVDGLSLVNRTVHLPDIRPDNGIFVVRNAQAQLIETPTGFVLENLTGDMTLDLPQNQYTVENVQVAPPNSSTTQVTASAVDAALVDPAAIADSASLAQAAAQRSALYQQAATDFDPERVVATDKLDVLYQFEDATTSSGMTNYTDSSKAKRHAACAESLRPCAELSDDGKHGKALDLSRSTESMVMPRWQVGSEGTIAFWFKCVGACTDQNSSITVGDRDFKVEISALEISLQTSIYSYGYHVGDFSLRHQMNALDSNWHHVAFSWAISKQCKSGDGSKQTQNVSIWLDGRQLAKKCSAIPFETNTVRSFQLQHQNIKSFIDDLRIYRSGLSESEIKQLAAGDFPQPRPASFYTQPVHFKFDEAAGATEGVESNYGLKTIYCASPCPPIPTPGKSGALGKAIHFNGHLNRLSIVNTGALNPTERMAVVTWIRPTADQWSQNPRILQKGDDGQQYRLVVENNKLRFEVALSTGVKVVETDILPVINRWSHVVGQYDGAELSLWVNGRKLASVAASGTLVTTEQALIIGDKPGLENTAVSGKWIGFLDDLRIYHRNLSNAEIQAQATSFTPPQAGEPDLLIALPMEDGTVQDSNGHYLWRYEYSSTRPENTSGKVGRSLRFSPNSAVRIRTAEAAPFQFFNPNQPFTIMFWAHGVPPSMDFGGGNTTLQVNATSDHKLQFSAYVNGNNSNLSNVLTSAQPALQSTWTHWAITFDGGTRRIFRNGTQVASAYGSPVGGLAWQAEGWMNLYSGALDDLRVYKKALTSQEIRLGNAFNPTLPVQIAGAEIKLTNPKIVGNSIQVESFKISLPGILGGQTVNVNSALTLNSQEQAIPGFPAGLVLGGGSKGFKISNVKATIKFGDNGYVITIKGDVGLMLPSEKDENQGVNASITMVMDANANISGSVENFDFSLAGFAMAAQNIKVKNETLKIGEASLTLPAPLDGSGASIYDMEITPPDDIKIGGGRLAMGPIKIGKFQLASIQGSLKKSGSEYEIGASATVALPGVGGNDTCAINAGVVFGVDTATGARTIDIYPLDPNAQVRYVAAGDTDVVVLPLHPDARLMGGPSAPAITDPTVVDPTVADPTTLPDGPLLTAASANAATAATARTVQIKEATLGLENCEIPLGQSGGYLTALKGTVQIKSGTTIIRVDVSLAYGKEIEPFGRIVTADLYAELGLSVPYFYPQLTREFTFQRNKVHNGRQYGSADSLTLSPGFIDRTEYAMPLVSSAGVENELNWRADSSKGTKVPIQPLPVGIGPQGEMSGGIMEAFAQVFGIRTMQVNPTLPVPTNKTLNLPTDVATQGNVRQTTTYPAQTYTALLRDGAFPFDPFTLPSNPSAGGDLVSVMLTQYCNALKGEWTRLEPPYSHLWGCIFDKGKLTIQDVYELERYRSDFTFKMGGEAKLFDTFTIGQADLSVDAVRGLDASLNAKLVGKYGPVDMQNFSAGISAWKDSRGFNLTGNVGVEIALTLKSITNGQIPVDKGIILGLAADFGKFQYSCRGTVCYAWGLKGTMTFDIPGFIDWIPGVPDVVSITVFGGWSSTERSFKFAFGGDAKQYQLVKRERVQRALVAQQQQLSAAAAGDSDTVLLPVDSDLTFLANGDNGKGLVSAAASDNVEAARAALATAEDVLVDVPVAYNTDMTVMLQKRNGGPGMVLIAPDGTEYPLDNDALPEGIGYSQLRQFLAAGGPGLGAGRGVARVRAVQTVDGTALNATITNNGDNSTTTLSNGLGFGEAAAYVDLPPGNYTVNFNANGQNAQSNLVLAAGQEMSLLAVGNPSNIQIWSVADNNGPIVTEEAGLRLLHAAPTAPRLTVKQLFGQEIFINQNYLTIGDPVELYPQEYDLGMHAVEQGDEMLSLETFKLAARHRYSLLVLQDAAGELTYRLLTDATPTSSVRLLNAGSEPIDLVVDDQPLVAALPGRTLTSDKALLVGEHNIRIQRGGVVFVQQSVVITENQDISLVYINGGLQTYTETNQVAETHHLLLRAVNLTGRGDLDFFVANEAVGQGLSQFAMSDYAPLRYRPDGLTVEVRQNGGLLQSFADIALAEGTATTLYLLDDNGTLRLIVGLDTAVNEETVDYLRLDGNAVQAGNWQVRLTDALNSSEEYALRVIGDRPEPILNEPSLVMDGNQATVGWQYTGSEADATIEIRLQEVSGPLQARALQQETRTVQMLDYRGYAQSQAVTDTVEMMPEYGDIFTVAFLAGTGEESWINGTPQQHTFSLESVPSGTYELQVVADDMVQPPVSASAPNRLLVSNPWPERWTSNLTTRTGEYQHLSLQWDAFPNADATAYVIMLEAPGLQESVAITTPLDTLAYTVTTLAPNTSYYVMVAAYDSNHDRYSYSEWVEVIPAGAAFEMAAVNAPATLKPGEPVTFDLNVTTQVDPHPAAVTLLAGERNPAHVQMAFEPDVVVPTVAGAQVRVVITPSRLLAGGIISLTIDAYGGGAERYVTITPQVQAADFALALSTNNVTLGQGPAELTVTANGLHGHSRTIRIDALALPDGIVATVIPTEINAGEQATVRFSQTDQAVRGSYTIAIHGDDGPNAERQDMTLVVQQPDFTVQAEQLQAAELGDGLDVRLNVGLVDGWAHPVTLSVEPSALPPGSNAGLTTTPGSDPSARGDGYAVTLPNGGAAYLYVTPGPDTPAGTYQITVYADSAGVRKEVVFSTDTLPVAKTEIIYLPVIMHGPQQQTSFGGDQRLYLPLVAK